MPGNISWPKIGIMFLYVAPVRTGGNSWTHVNMHRGSSTVAKIKAHWVEFRKLWNRLEDIACLAIPHGIAIFIEWPRGCKYWALSNVARFLAKYCFQFADFYGCMYGLVALHGKDAGLSSKEPWRVAYSSSSLRGFLSSKCDGSHDHSSCSGQDTSGTGCYTPLIAKAIHQFCRRDVQLHGVDSSDNASLVMPAALSVLKLCSGDTRNHWVDLLMAGQPPKPGEGSWPLPTEVRQSPPQAKEWRKQKLKVAEGQESRAKAR